MPLQENKSWLPVLFCLGSSTRVQSGCEVLSCLSRESVPTSKSRDNLQHLKKGRLSTAETLQWKAIFLPSDKSPPLGPSWCYCWSDIHSNNFSLPAVFCSPAIKGCTCKINFPGVQNVYFTPSQFYHYFFSFLFFSHAFFTSQQYLSKLKRSLFLHSRFLLLSWQLCFNPGKILIRLLKQ